MLQPTVSAALPGIVLAVILAAVAAPVVRTVTSGLSGLAGTAWPFSMEHCRHATPGCEGHLRLAGGAAPLERSPMDAVPKATR